MQLVETGFRLVYTMAMVGFGLRLGDSGAWTSMDSEVQRKKQRNKYTCWQLLAVGIYIYMSYHTQHTASVHTCTAVRGSFSAEGGHTETPHPGVRALFMKEVKCSSATAWTEENCGTAMMAFLAIFEDLDFNRRTPSMQPGVGHHGALYPIYRWYTTTQSNSKYPPSPPTA